MKAQWYVARFTDGKFMDHSPHVMTKREANHLLSLAGLTDKGFTYKVIHKNDLKDPKYQK
jgi:hypothetical protein